MLIHVARAYKYILLYTPLLIVTSSEDLKIRLFQLKQKGGAEKSIQILWKRVAMTLYAELDSCELIERYALWSVSILIDLISMYVC